MIDQIPGKNPFRVPENYFEEVNRKIISVTAGEVKTGKNRSFSYRFRTQLAVAASVTGIILLTYIGVRLMNAEKNITQISEAVFYENKESYLNEIDLYTLEESVSLEGISEQSPDVSNKDIIDYLLRENVEISDIYEHL